MAFNLSKFARMGEFTMETNALGRVLCVSLTANHLSQANKKLATAGVQCLDVVRWLFGEMARRPVDGASDEHDPENDPRFTSEELASVTDTELEDFAVKLVQQNRGLLLKTHKGSDIHRLGDESACDFLARAFRHYAAEEKANMKRLTANVADSIFPKSALETLKQYAGLSDQLKYVTEMEKLTKSASGNLFADTTLESVERNLGLSGDFQDTIDRYALGLAADKGELTQPILRTPEFQLPVFPENPIHETNEKLENVVRQIEDLRPMATKAAELIRSMNDVALRMQADYIKNAEASGRQTRNAIWIAAISLAVSAVGLVISSFFSYQSYVDGKQSGATNAAQIAAFQAEIRAFAVAEREGQAAIVNAIVDRRPASAASAAK